MAKNKNRTPVELTVEQQKAIAEHREQIRKIKYKGSFKEAYRMVRKGTVDINNNDKTDAEKKTELIGLLSETLQELTGSENE